jgi:hypothetical protein
MKKNKSDLIRSWTIDVEGESSITNALGIIYDAYWIEIH